MAKDRASVAEAPPKRVRNQGVLKVKERQVYFDARASGAGKLASASLAGVTPKTAQKWEQAWIEAGNEDFDKGKITGPRRNRRDHSVAARQALDNFSVFQERYLGRVALPWQKTAADEVVRLSRSPEREYLVVNLCPGSGKSTLITHDIPCWMIAKNRGIRICILSSTQKNAEKFADRIRRTLEATVPIQAPEKELSQGIAKDAVTTMAKDFGRFKPEEATTWTKQKFFVERPSEDESHKDATVEAFGKDQAFLGGRYDVVILDDVYDPKQVKTYESKEEIKEWYSDVAESRLEPGGLLMMVMQRVDSEDLSRYALDMEAYELLDEDLEDEEVREAQEEKARLGIDDLPLRDGKRRKYRHLAFKAHDDDNCKGSKYHKLSAPPFPEGCLLYPRRLSYRDLMTKKANDPGKYQVWYNQEDIALGSTLVEPVWIKGGKDEFGIERPGCWDNHRGVRELPIGITGNIFSFLTVDPSPSQYWAVEWWIYHQPSNELFLIDLERRRMTSPEFFDQNPNTHEVSGILCDIFDASNLIGAPITHLVPEVNAAQKFMYEQSAMVQWMRMRGIALMPHTTTAQNKNSQEFGVQGLQPWFRDGRIRLPGRQNDTLNTRTRTMKLVSEAERYRLDGENSSTTDCVMAAWFAMRAVGNLYRPKKALPMQHRPAFMRRPILEVAV